MVDSHMYTSHFEISCVRKEYPKSHDVWAISAIGALISLSIQNVHMMEAMTYT